MLPRRKYKCEHNSLGLKLTLQEFEVTLTKIQGSLGFTLRKEDDSALGHYIRALVREPALSDGRIHEGDKIIAVSLPYSYSLIAVYYTQKGVVRTFVQIHLSAPSTF